MPSGVQLTHVAIGAALALTARAWLVWVCKRLRRSAGLDKASLLQQRQRNFCPAQSISYANTDPLLVVRGSGCTLEDEAGRRFLDTRNNVAHVGHAHPTVAAAVASQVAELNTNTRYLHPNVCELARRLLATMPAPLSDGVVFFVNSGSEANDLALRLAQASNRDGSEHCIVIDHAYHGVRARSLSLRSPLACPARGRRRPLRSPTLRVRSAPAFASAAHLCCHRPLALQVRAQILRRQGPAQMGHQVCGARHVPRTASWARRGRRVRAPGDRGLQTWRRMRLLHRVGHVSRRGDSAAGGLPREVTRVCTLALGTWRAGLACCGLH